MIEKKKEQILSEIKQAASETDGNFRDDSLW